MVGRKGSSFSNPIRSPETEVLPLPQKDAPDKMVGLGRPINDDRTCDHSTFLEEEAEDLALKKAEEALSLKERETRWGFLLSELQTTAKVVTILFKNPSLFVADPYLAESRLYTMITRDRKTKRENRDVYKKIMNEEKSRRRRYQRFQDVEAVRKTTMKREREEALQSLLLPPSPTTPGSQLLEWNGVAPPDEEEEEGKETVEPHSKSQAGEEEKRGKNYEENIPDGNSAQKKRPKTEPYSHETLKSMPGEGNSCASLSETEVTPDLPVPHEEGTSITTIATSEGQAGILPANPSSWSEMDRTLFRMVGAFENICRLDACRVGVTHPPSPCTSRGGDIFMSGAEEGEKRGRGGGEHGKTSRKGAPAVDVASSVPPLSSSFSSHTKSSPTPSATCTAVAVTLSQLTAQVYRYLPHSYGTQMPPPLFPGPVPRSRVSVATTSIPAEAVRSSGKNMMGFFSIFSFIRDNIPLEHQMYLAAWELCMARAMIKLVPLKPIPRPIVTSSCSNRNIDERKGTTGEVEYLAHRQGDKQLSSPTRSTIHPAFINGEEVIVCGAPLPIGTLSSFSFTPSMAVKGEKREEKINDVVWLYRHWMSWLHQFDVDATVGSGKISKEVAQSNNHQNHLGEAGMNARGTTPHTGEEVAASVQVMQEWSLRSGKLVSAGCSGETLLNEIEAVLVGEVNTSEGNATRSTFFESFLKDVEDSSSPVKAALSTLRFFLLRRCYELAAVRYFPPSPIVIDTKPPTSDDVEPDIFNVYDDLQLYANETTSEEHLKVSKLASCYTCKVRYKILHPYYYSMCHLCGEYNYNKRLMTADLRGKNVLLTGCRIKIGYMMALSLLRCGARLLGTTRFAHEALARFRAEPDYPLWKDRLHLFSLDLRDMWMTTQFCHFVRMYFGGKLYAIINNAAQTIARTPAYTASLRALEQCPPADLQEALAEDKRATMWHHFFCRHSTMRIGVPLALETEHVKLEAGISTKASGKRNLHQITAVPYASPTISSSSGSRSAAGESDASAEGRNESSSAEEELPPEVCGPNAGHTAEDTTSSLSAGADHYKERPISGTSGDAGSENGTGVMTIAQFDRYDTFAEESDLREKNSWVMNLAEVSGGEAAEVMAINALSPFIINAKLKPCLLNREGEETSPLLPPEPRFIINVSAMEGQFYRYKQTTHPHTNMAKAALNMMSRTSGEDYAADGIYMNSVDTGWITDESPKAKKERRADQLLLCPLDEVDAAARCLDLIYVKSREYGKFYKDFKEIPW